MTNAPTTAARVGGEAMLPLVRYNRPQRLTAALIERRAPHAAVPRNAPCP